MGDLYLYYCNGPLLLLFDTQTEKEQHSAFSISVNVSFNQHRNLHHVWTNETRE